MFVGSLNIWFFNDPILFDNTKSLIIVVPVESIFEILLVDVLYWTYSVICVGIIDQLVAFVVLLIVKTLLFMAVELLEGKTNFSAVEDPTEELITKSVIVVGVPDTLLIKIVNISDYCFWYWHVILG